jgi:hypothetical protein
VPHVRWLFQVISARIKLVDDNFDLVNLCLNWPVLELHKETANVFYFRLSRSLICPQFIIIRKDEVESRDVEEYIDVKLGLGERLRP